VVRNVALRFEQRRRGCVVQQAGAGTTSVPDASSEADLAVAFDRAWARCIMKEAAERQRQRAVAKGPAAQRRVALLGKRFNDNLPIRSIAREWGVQTAVLHHEYAQARREFRDALEEVLLFYNPHSAYELEKECLALLSLLR